MTTKVEPTVEGWEKYRKFFRGQISHVSRCGKKDCKEGVHIFDDIGNPWKLKDLEEVFVKETARLVFLSVQEAKAEGEKIVIADDGDYIKVPMTVIKHIWDMRMPQTSHWRESGEIHYNKAIEDILRLIKPNILSHSVQEAKAEERKEMITKLHNIRSKIHGYISLVELTDLLSTLNTKASLKQEEGK